jgi:hypothetical protein
MKLETIIENLLNKLFPKRMSPKLAVVNKVYTNADKGTYCCDVEIVRTGDLERTGKSYKEVPISPIWAGKDKRGLYCTLQKDIIVIINFIDWDEAHPYVDGIWSDQYETFEHPENEFLIIAQSIEFRMKEQDKKIIMKVGDDSEMYIDLESFMIGGNGATDYLIKGDTFKQALENVLKLLKNHTHLIDGIMTGQGSVTSSTSQSLQAITNPCNDALSSYAKVK